MTSLMKKDATSEAALFGLIGDFPGDETKLEAASAMMARLLSSAEEASKLSADEIVDVLDQLPMKGRFYLVLQGIGPSPACRGIVKKLFDWCFAEDEEAGVDVTTTPLQAGEDDDAGLDQDFVVVLPKARDLNPKRNHVLRVLAMTAGELGEAGVELCREYLASSSTIFSKLVAQSMTKNQSVDDDELEEVYHKSVVAHQEAIVSICEQVSHRCNFLHKLYQKGLVPFTVLFANPDSTVIRSILEKEPTAGFRKWMFHAPLYLNMLEASFRKLAHDPLGRGAALRSWETRCEGATDFSPEHAMQISRLCDKYRPMEVISTTDKYVESILVKASAAGELGNVPTDLKQVLAAFPVCCKKINKHDYAVWILAQTQPCSDGLGVGFVDPTQEAFLSGAIASFDVYSRLGDFVPNYLDSVSEELFWRALREDASKDTCSVRFFRVVASICKALSQGRRVNLSREATYAWKRLHMRCKPPKVVPDNDKKDPVRSDWHLWHQSYMDVVVGLARNISRRHEAAIRRSAPTGLSSATLWVGFSRIVLDIEVEGHLTMYKAGFVEKLDTALNLLNVLETVESTPANHGDFLTCHALAEKVVAIVRTQVLPILDEFDTAKEDERDKVVRRVVPLVVRLCRGHCKDRPGFLVSMAHLIRGYSQRALPSDALVKNPCIDETNSDADGRMVRTFHRANVEQQQACADSLVSDLQVVFELLCTHCSARQAAGAPEPCIAAALPIDVMQRELQLMYSWFPVPKWMLHLRDGKEVSLPETTKMLSSISDRVKLIVRVAAAWPGIVAAETPLLIALGKHVLVARNWYQQCDRDFRELGIDHLILDDCSEQLRHTFLVARNSNVLAPGVRDYLSDQTKGRDPTERMNGYVMLLRLSFGTGTSLEEFARSAKFVADRTKNEAGLYRSTILDYLVQSVYAVAEKSFVEAYGANSAEQEKAAIESAKIVCEAFTKMLRDDVAKRDTVGRSRFLSISKELLRFCLVPRVGRLAHTGLELHSVWVSEALRLQWIIVEVAGEVQLRNFNWQLPFFGITDNWVDVASFDSLIGPLLEDEVLMRRIRAVIHSGQHWADGKSLNLDERVSLLQKGLVAVKKEHAVRNPDSSMVAKDDGISEVQLNSLLSLTKQRWVQVPVLVRAISESTPARGFDRAYRVFKLACSVFPCAWFHVPLLALACDSLFRAAVMQSRREAREILFTYWLPMRKRLAVIDFSEIESAPPVSSFFLSLFSGQLKGELEAAVQKRAQRIPDDFSCSVARTLLDMTKSSWFLSDVVKEVIEKSRDDVLADFLESGGNTSLSLNGVFCPYTKNDGQVHRPIVFIKSATQVQLRSKALCLYADFCLSIALSKNDSLQVRSTRVTEFVEAPCIGAREILRLLEQFEEGPLLETLLLSIFRVDSAWKVLAYLLRPSVIACRSPRTTGGLLDRVAKEMHTRDVELVLSVLLKEGPRQKALTPYLMKCIFRSLFDIGSETAAGLIRGQWNRGKDLHNDVRHDLVRLAVLVITPSLCGSAPTTKHLNSVAWEIVEESCTNPDLELDSAVLILAPQWTSSSTMIKSFVNGLASPTGLIGFQLPQETDSAKKEAFQTLNSKLCKARETIALGLRLSNEAPEIDETRDAINRYGKALRALSESNTCASVRVQARCHSHVFVSSCLLGIDEESIGFALKELQDILETLLAQTESPRHAFDIYESYEFITIREKVLESLRRS